MHKPRGKRGLLAGVGSPVYVGEFTGAGVVLHLFDYRNQALGYAKHLRAHGAAVWLEGRNAPARRIQS